MEETRKKEKTQVFSALSLAWQLGYTIVIPLVVFALLGRLLDKQFNSSPLLFILGIVLAVLVTSIWLVAKLKQFTQEIEESSKEKKPK